MTIVSRIRRLSANVKSSIVGLLRLGDIPEVEVNKMDIEERLRRLEWKNRLYSILLAIIGAYAGIGYVGAEDHTAKVVADSVVTRSLSVVNAYGKHGVKIDVGDSGIVSLGLYNVKGKSTISLFNEADGLPSICLEDGNTCRIVIGEVYRGTKPEFSLQLRDKNGEPIWMPETPNPFILPR
jgi:hypothetical protein